MSDTAVVQQQDSTRFDLSGRKSAAGRKTNAQRLESKAAEKQAARSRSGRSRSSRTPASPS
jgi:hypothetical protein